MYEDTIKTILTTDSATKKCFVGVYARDELPKFFNNYPVCIVINTDKRSEPGEHWLALYIDVKKDAIFFDPYGLSPSYYKLEFYIKSVSKKLTWNQKMIQGLSEYCGFYCVLFLLMAARRDLSRFFEQFSTNAYKNDSILTNLIHKYKNEQIYYPKQ